MITRVQRNARRHTQVTSPHTLCQGCASNILCMTLFLRSQSRSNFTAQLGVNFRRLFILQSRIQPHLIKTVAISEPFLTSRSQMMMDDSDAAQESHNDTLSAFFGLTRSLKQPSALQAVNHVIIWNSGSISSMYRSRKETFGRWPFFFFVRNWTQTWECDS